VEKVIYALIGGPGAGGPSLGRVLCTETAAALRRQGARRLQVNVVDAALGPPFGVAPDADTPSLTATVSMWVNTAEGFDVRSLLPDPGAAGAWSGYLVTEAEPLPNTTVPPGADGRIPGFAQMVLLGRPDGLSWGEWRRVWQGSHTSVALATQSSFRYVQNVIFRAVTPEAPPYVAVVEECFPRAAASDLHVFFDAVGDEQRLARHMAAMSESCDRFMDGSSPVSWTAEYLLPDEP
jgi:EthD domain